MKQKKEINKDILIGDLVEGYPKLASVLVKKYNFHCIGCMAAGMETLEQGATVHGMDEKEIEKMIKYLRTQVKVD
ncbi:MAG: DUF1858 domain-containing protein [Candidatus Shapirobacteria bacterium]|nr:DUF1858 domain-containing protein [Candidatus Shapirobacteria bacterium]